VRTSPTPEIERGRVLAGNYGSPPGASFGLFFIRRRGVQLKIMSSGGGEDMPEEAQGWEHVSISTPSRCPTWEEMAWIKDQFFGEEETVLQFHPPRSRYVNHSEFCLHLWRKQGVAVELPPPILI
jgi:hypothetical protein